MWACGVGSRVQWFAGGRERAVLPDPVPDSVACIAASGRGGLKHCTVHLIPMRVSRGVALEYGDKGLACEGAHGRSLHHKATVAGCWHVDVGYSGSEAEMLVVPYYTVAVRRTQSTLTRALWCVGGVLLVSSGGRGLGESASRARVAAMPS